jgi:hypothetical protein
MIQSLIAGREELAEKRGSDHRHLVSGITLPWSNRIVAGGTIQITMMMSTSTEIVANA